MYLVIDVGNTNIVLGVYTKRKLIMKQRLHAQIQYTVDEMVLLLELLLDKQNIVISDIKETIISTVIPSMRIFLAQVIETLTHKTAMLVDYQMKLNIILPTGMDKEPENIGTDRIINGVAGMDLYGGDIIIIDYGTANKYDYLDTKGEFITGITAPGIGVRAQGLFQHAALLPEVELVRPQGLITTDTVHSVQAGIIYGTLGETEYLIKHLKKELNAPHATVVATGGYVHLIKDATNKIDIVNEDLTLYGLLKTLEMNL